jgi:hypothetical protein
MDGPVVEFTFEDVMRNAGMTGEHQVSDAIRTDEIPAETIVRRRQDA